jgi:hypothetical protein
VLNPNPNLGLASAVIHGEHLSRATTIGAHDYGVSLAPRQEHRLVVPDRCPAPYPPPPVAAAAVMVVLVVVAAVGDARRARLYVCARECARNHVQIEAQRR